MKTVKVVAAVIRENDKIFATQRGYGEFKDGWEFPGGKIEEGETAKDALVREIREELDTEIKVGQLIDTVEYDCFLDTSSTLSLSNSTEYDMATMQRIVAVVQTKELDAVIFDSQCYEQYAMNEIFYDLREILTEEQIEKYEPYFYYVDMDVVRAQEEEDVMVDTDAIAAKAELTAEEINAQGLAHMDPSTMSDPVPVGIVMTDSPFETESLAYEGLVPVFGISVTTQRLDTALEFLDYLWDDTIDFSLAHNADTAY